MAVLRLFWLGPPAVEYDGRPLQLEMRKTLALVAYLSLNLQNPTRETLASLFWPEYDQQHALANLRRNLSSLARSLPFGLLEADRETIGLRKVDWLKVDVDEFHQQLSIASQHSHLANTACPECLPFLEKAVALYRGNFFEGFSLKDCPEFDEWQFSQREGLQSECARTIEKLSDYYASLGQWEKAISHTRSWVAFDRLSEPARRMLISLLAQSGQPWAARRQSEELVRLLREELDQKPADETIELFRTIQVKTQETQKSISKPLILDPVPTRVLEPLLKTKLYIPFSKGAQVFREQVVSKLNQIQEHALTILSAPAGYGKTTAISEWTKQSLLPVGWLSLDEADNHQVRFLTYLIAALQSVESEIGERVLALLQSPQPVPIRAIVTNLIHELEKVSSPLVLVLDDYQFIDAESIHKVLALLLDRLPNNIHLVISTRVDPPLNLARLRTQGKLLEIRVQDLRFTAEEILIFFNELMGLGISSEDIALLDERIEGWAVGLQMAALSLQKSPDKSKTIQAFSGSNRYILDYLLEEVVERQPKYVQDFLLQTSILEQMNGSLCDAVTGIREWSVGSQPSISIHELPLSSQQILEYLERSNLFVQSLDNERCWYRYHHLFAELLNARLEHFHPDLVESLHTHACEWYERNGFIPPAVRHALLSRSFSYAAGVIERAISTNLIWSSGDLALLLSWVDALPTKVLIMNPLLRIYLSAALYVTGDFKKSNQILEELERSLPQILKTVPNPALTEQLFLNFRVLYEGTKGNISRAIEDSSRSRALATGDEMANLLGINYLIWAYLIAGDVENGLRTAYSSYEGLSAKGYTLQAVNNAKNTADLYILQGRLTDAVDVCQRAIARCKSSGELNPIAGVLGLPIGAVLLERNELEMAEKYVQESLELLAKGPIRNDFGQGHALLAMIKLAQGDQERAVHLIDRALQIAEYAEIPRIIHLIQAYRARIWLAQGENDLALNWAGDYRLIGPTEYPREIEDLTLAHILISQGQRAEAYSLLDGLLAKARASGRCGRVIEILILLAMVNFCDNRTGEALSLLEESLRSACREGYTRVYLDRGEPMRALLKRYKDKRDEENERIQLKEGELLGYVDQVLVAFDKE